VHLVRLRNQWHPFLKTRTNRKTFE
jgi:hypothetical protein